MRLNKRQLQGLIDSIEKKWIPIYEGTVNYEPECPLCTLYGSQWRNGCIGCPIKNYTKREACWNTPYYTWRNQYWWVGQNIYPQSIPALKELQFLISLLPKKHQIKYKKYTEDV